MFQTNLKVYLSYDEHLRIDALPENGRIGIRLRQIHVDLIKEQTVLAAIQIVA